MASNRRLITLKRTLNQLEMTIPLPGSADRCLELVRAAQGITSDLLKTDKLPAAAVLGARGGTQTAKRGSDYFRQLAAKRKTKAGGRPRKVE